jgi:hypothetical protein
MKILALAFNCFWHEVPISARVDCQVSEYSQNDVPDIYTEKL